MNKKKEILLVVFVFLVVTFFLSNVSALSTTTYNFNDASTVFTGGEDFDNDVYPPDNTLPPDSIGAFSVTELNRMKALDGSYATSGIPDDAEGYAIFNSSVGNGIVTALNWSWYGRWDNSDSDASLHYFIWNVTGSNWYECLSNNTASFTTITLKSCAITSSVSDFYDASRRSYFMVWGTDPNDLDSFGAQIGTDYIDLAVTTDSVSLNIVAPENFQEFNTNLSLPLNFTISGPSDTIWWNLDNGANTTITGNITFNTSDGSHVLYLFANDTDNNLFSDSVSFTVSLDAPSITLDYPDNATYFNSGTDIYLNYTATDSNGIDHCDIYHNINGTWALNQTNSGVTSGVQNFTTVNASDGSYLWNIFCVDGTAQSRFSTLNRTFIVDETKPLIYNISVGTSAGSQTINFTYNLTETNPSSCKYSIYDNNSAIDGLNNNISITCEAFWEATVSDYGNFTLRIYALDLAGNENSTDYNFTTTASSPVIINTGGGGGAGEPGKDLIPVIGLLEANKSSKTYNTLEREVMYAKINSYCSTKKSDQLLAIEDLSGECTLNVNDLALVNQDIFALGISVTDQDLIEYYKAYTNKQLFQGYEEEETITKYGLFTSVLGIPNPMTIFPASFRAPVFRFAPGDTIVIEKTFLVNKNIRECSVTKGDGALTCEILTNTTFKMVYTINNTDFFDKTFTGELTVTSDAKPENLEVKPVPISLNVYNFSGQLVGIPVFVWIMGLLLIIIVGGLVWANNKRFKNKLFKRRKK